MKKIITLMVLATALAACHPALPAASNDAETKKLTFIVINDTYRPDLFPHLRTLRSELAKKEGEVIVVHAGDFLSPSLLSQRYNGEQMIDIFNRLDGDDKAYDPYFYITFGNHEFDKDKFKHAPLLQSRINESQFDWLGSNIVFKADGVGQKLIQGSNLLSSKLITVNGIKVGLLSATTDVKNAEYIERFLPPVETVGKITRHLRDQGAQVVVAITHQTVAQDKLLLEALKDNAPDFIAGGHEHDRQDHTVNGRRLVKADADIASAAVVRVDLGETPLKTSVEFVQLPGTYAPDAGIQARVAHWNTRFGGDYCTEKGAPITCMQDVLGISRVDLIGEELTIRRFETNLGNLLADTARAAYAKEGAQIAFLNSGGMRLNYNIPAGNITRMHIDTLFAYPTPLVLIKLTGKQLQEVINHAITDWTGNGRWLQISGFAFTHDPELGIASGLQLITPNGMRSVKPDETILAVTNDYLINTGGDRDGYVMLSEALVLDEKLARPELKQVLMEHLKHAGASGISPRIEGRICNTGKKAPGNGCL